MIFRNLHRQRREVRRRRAAGRGDRALARRLGDARVSDNGRGIPPELRRKIFGRFVGWARSWRRDKPGTGLGLYIVRTLVRRLRGTIRVTIAPRAAIVRGPPAGGSDLPSSRWPETVPSPGQLSRMMRRRSANDGQRQAHPGRRRRRAPGRRASSTIWRPRATASTTVGDGRRPCGSSRRTATTSTWWCST